MKIGFIGLGLMGGGMARHIAQTVKTIMVYDIVPEARRKFADACLVAETMEEVFGYAEVLMLSLPGSPEVEPIIDRLLATDIAGKAIIDFSTSYPKSSKKIAERVAKAGGKFLDASLTGNPARAEIGTLHAVVGGSKDDYESLLPVLQLVTEKTFYAGGPGSGNLIKLATNYLAILYINLYAEIFPLVEKNGGDLQVLFDVVANSVSGCGMFQRIAPKIMTDNYEVSFLMKHAIKDLMYVKQLGIDDKVPVMMLDSGLSQYLIARSQGLQDKDVSEVARVLKDMILN
jgi:3-hydroxyisobutyrate dehydrogenase-like beta-hydroxyacid dehydrogenase